MLAACDTAVIVKLPAGYPCYRKNYPHGSAEILGCQKILRLTFSVHLDNQSNPRRAPVECLLHRYSFPRVF